MLSSLNTAAHYLNYFVKGVTCTVVRCNTVFYHSILRNKSFYEGGEGKMVKMFLFWYFKFSTSKYSSTFIIVFFLTVLINFEHYTPQIQ